MFSKQFTKHFFIIQCILICYQFNPTTALIGPNVRFAQENEFPFVVSIAGLENTNQNQIYLLHRCTGSLVTRQDVLTAEHCLRRRMRDGFKVLVGSRDLSRTTTYFPLFIWTYEHWLIYKQRQTVERENHDIAFVKLLANIPANLTTVPYGNIENEMLFGLPVQIAGWGRRDDGSKPRFLHTADVIVLTQRECESRMSAMENRRTILDRNSICTVGNPYAVTSRGDSGGPLIYYGVLVAVNHGVTPVVRGEIVPTQINVHVGIRLYQEFFEEIQVQFYVNFVN